MDKFGILLIKKPAGITSFDLIRKLRRVIKIKQIGHAGTLDPFAEGLMQILVGKATKIAQYLTNHDKSYKVTMQFGIQTDTGDITGEVIAEEDLSALDLDFVTLKRKVEELQSQIPPKYSAIKVNGQRAYKLARSEQDFTMIERPIEITDFQVIEYSFPFLTYSCCVSKGTYIRTLSEQIAELFNTIATTTKLTRLTVSNVKLEDAVALDEITSENWTEYLLPIEKLLDAPIIELTEVQSNDFWFGRQIKISDSTDLDSPLVITKYADQTKGLAKINNGVLQPTKVFK